jgi:hypothetical protein
MDLSFQQVLDVIGGAIDARFAPQRHLAASGQPVEGAHMPAVLKSVCARRGANYTTRDSLKSAAFLIGASFAIMGASIVCRENDWMAASRFLKTFAFPAALMLSSLFTFLKGHSPVTKFVVVGAPLFVIAGMCLATAIR